MSFHPIVLQSLYLFFQLLQKLHPSVGFYFLSFLSFDSLDSFEPERPRPKNDARVEEG
jgi:hypothetical protein